MKYRKKPVVIEAIKLENNRNSIYDAVEFVFNIGMETSIIGTEETINMIRIKDGLDIPTLEGTMHASFGDYIIKGVNGEFYPCKEEIFLKTYEPAE